MGRGTVGVVPTAGAWLELSIEADLEAVETISEILGRVATGGTTVEPAYDLVDEGLGARVDPSRPAVVRGYVPARDASAAQAAVVEVAEALGVGWESKRGECDQQRQGREQGRHLVRRVRGKGLRFITRMGQRQY